MIMENIKPFFSVSILREFLPGKIPVMTMELVLCQDNQKPMIWLEKKVKYWKLQGIYTKGALLSVAEMWDLGSCHQHPVGCRKNAGVHRYGSARSRNVWQPDNLTVEQSWDHFVVCYRQTKVRAPLPIFPCLCNHPESHGHVGCP